MTEIFFRVEFNLPKTAPGRFKIHKIEAEMCAFTTSSFLRILISNAHRIETGGAATWKFKGSCKFKDTSEHKPPSADMPGEKISSRHFDVNFARRFIFDLLSRLKYIYCYVIG